MRRINAKLSFGVIFILYLDLLALIDIVTAIDPLRSDLAMVLMIVGFLISAFVGSKMSKEYNPENNADSIFVVVLIALGIFFISYLVALI